MAGLLACAAPKRIGIWSTAEDSVPDPQKSPSSSQAIETPTGAAGVLPGEKDNGLSEVKPSRRWTRMVPVLLLVGFLTHLVSERFIQGTTHQSLGDVTVALSVQKGVVSPGQNLVHVEVLTPDQLRPIQNARLQAWRANETPPLALGVFPSNEVGAFEVVVPVETRTDFDLEVSAMSPIGRLHCRLIPGEKSVLVLSSERLDPVTGAPESAINTVEGRSR